MSTSSISQPHIRISPLTFRPPPSHSDPPAHHIGNPPTSFTNPWPSYAQRHSLFSVFQTRISKNRNFVPVPESRDKLVPIRKPDWGAQTNGLKATWIGHASFLVETPRQEGSERGVRIFFDPVFSEVTGPYNKIGPRRFSPTPCKLEEVPEVDIVAISHNHYDHLDAPTIRALHARGKGKLRVFCALGVGDNIRGMGLKDEEIVEMDWWEGVHIDLEGVGSARLTCTPSQHFSGRGIFDHGSTLWCSWTVEEGGGAPAKSECDTDGPRGKNLFFAGDTGYCAVPNNDASNADHPHCPAFEEIGKMYGPFDLALLPIGCFLPRTFMSAVHCAPEDSIQIHKDIRSKKSIGMHYGTIRGGISAQYEDVREPPRRWKEFAEKEELKWGEEVGVCDLGETVVV